MTAESHKIAFRVFTYASDLLHQVSEDAVKQIVNKNQDLSMVLEASMSIPAIVLLAFSIEIGFKNILAETGNQKRTHDLKVLFESLNTQKQEQIISHFESRDKFLDTLEKNSKHFQEWRYFNEGDVSQVDIVFLKQLNVVIKGIIFAENNS